MERTNKLSKKEKFLFSFLVLWLPAPPLQGNMICRMICIVAILYLFWKKTKRGAVPVYLLATFFLIFYMIMIGELVGDNINQHMALYLVLVYSVCTVYLYDVDDIRDYEFLIWEAFLVMTVWNVLTIRALMSDGHIMRALVKNTTVNAGFGVGGYGHAYTTVLLLPMALDCVIKERNKKHRIVAGMYLLTTVYMILNSGYLLSILTMLVGLLYFLIMRQKSKNNVVWFIIIFAALIIIYINLSDILMFFINRMKIGGMRLKLQEIYNMLNEDTSLSGLESSAEFGTRYERYTRDLGLIAGSPMWGSLSFMEVGKHSTILDMFAQYGFPIGLMFCYALIKPLRQRAIKISLASTVLEATVVELFFVLLLNNVAMGMGIIYILIPVYCLSRQRYG